MLSHSPHQSLLFFNENTLWGLNLSLYVLIKILKFCTGSPTKSYQSKFAIHDVLGNSGAPVEELGRGIQEVIHHNKLRGKFSSVHPELRQEGIIRVEVVKEGLCFIRDSGAILKYVCMYHCRFEYKDKIQTSGHIIIEEF